MSGPHGARPTSTVDPLTAEYASFSPFQFTANNPLKFIDPDGRLVVYASGFQIFGEPGPGQDNKRITWDRDLVQAIANDLSDHSKIFFKGGDGLGTSWEQRFDAGYAQFSVYFGSLEELDQRRLGFLLVEGETIKLIAHSQGAAWAEGFATAAIEAGWEVEIIVHFNPYQGKDSKGKVAPVSQDQRYSIIHSSDLPGTKSAVANGRVYAVGGSVLGTFVLRSLEIHAPIGAAAFAFGRAFWAHTNFKTASNWNRFWDVSNPRIQQ